jgi:hypothetical protein
MGDSKVVFTIQDNGELKIDAREMIGTEKELEGLLGGLAVSLGGELKVEKHIEEGHTHHHEREKGKERN